MGCVFRIGSTNFDILTAFVANLKVGSSLLIEQKNGAKESWQISIQPNPKVDFMRAPFFTRRTNPNLSADEKTSRRKTFDGQNRGSPNTARGGAYMARPLFRYFQAGVKPNF